VSESTKQRLMASIKGAMDSAAFYDWTKVDDVVGSPSQPSLELDRARER
jgi:hypothetical protein